MLQRPLIYLLGYILSWQHLDEQQASSQQRVSMTRLTLRIDFDNGSQIGHGKIRLLELIALHGSISRAAKEMSMSYRRAWLLADAMNHMFRTPVIETQHGGSGGGHAKLTSFGHALVGHYRAFETQSMRLFSKQLSELERDLAA